MLVDSITEAVGPGAGQVVVSGSHGGASAARYALQLGAHLAVFNDAGVGREAAGIAALPLLQAAGLAACTVSHTSACIGQARSTLEHGVVSHANDAARRLGVREGVALLDALRAAGCGRA